MTESESYAISLTANEWATVIGWLRNGNHTSSDLADKIKKTLDKLRGKEADK